MKKFSIKNVEEYACFLKVMLIQYCFALHFYK